MPAEPLRLLALAAPLFLLGFAAGGLRALGRRQGLPQATRRRYQLAWVLALLVGAPLWLVLSAVLRIW